MPVKLVKEKLSSMRKNEASCRGDLSNAQGENNALKRETYHLLESCRITQEVFTILQNQLSAAEATNRTCGELLVHFRQTKDTDPGKNQLAGIQYTPTVQWDPWRMQMVFFFLTNEDKIHFNWFEVPSKYEANVESAHQ